MADLLNRQFRPVKRVDPSHIVLAAGGSFALTALVEQICDPGDGILIATPYWAGLDISISIHGHARIVPVHMALDKFFCPESVQYYDSAMDNASIPIKAVLLCNPHNPLGQCYPRETLQALQDFCKRKTLHYISDEVYALSAHRPAPDSFVSFVSALETCSEEISDQMHIIYSVSKDFGCSGIRLVSSTYLTTAPTES
jgi:aspartate/methionine/tyrosine aminotransferase